MTVHPSEAAEYAAIMTGGPLFALAYAWMALVGVYDLAAAARLAWRIARGVFLAVGWAGVAARLLLWP